MAKKELSQQHCLSVISLLSGALLLFPLPPISAVSSSPPDANATDFIRTSCVATLYPDLCYTSLSPYANNVQQTPLKLARVAVGLSLSEARRVDSYISKLSRLAGAESRAVAALRDCISSYAAAVDEIQRSLKQIRRLRLGEALSFEISNVQTWMSAALTNEETCTDGFELVSDGALKSGVRDRGDYLTKLTSNALALVNSFAAKFDQSP